MKKVIATILSCALLASLTGATDVEETQIEETTETTEPPVEETVEETTETSYEEVVESSIAEETIEEAEISIEETTAETEVTIEETTVSETEVIEETTVAETVVEETIEEVVETEVIENLYDYENITSYSRGEVVTTEIALFDVNVRAIADPNGEVVATVLQGQEVIVLATSFDSPWVIVEVNGVTGYANRCNFLPEYNPQMPYISEEEAEAMWAIMCGWV